jgi:hypothetical protein
MLYPFPSRDCIIQIAHSSSDCDMHQFLLENLHRFFWESLCGKPLPPASTKMHQYVARVTSGSYYVESVSRNGDESRRAMNRGRVRAFGAAVSSGMEAAEFVSQTDLADGNRNPRKFLLRHDLVTICFQENAFADNVSFLLVSDPVLRTFRGGG